jgi:hypothetical protein
MVEIQQLYARYNHAIDFGNADAWAGCFTPDGLFSAAGTGEFRGTSALAEFARSMAGRTNGRHWTNNLLVEGEGAGATARCYLLYVQNSAAGKPPTALLTGVYSDTLARGPAGWRFATRSFAPDA